MGLMQSKISILLQEFIVTLASRILPSLHFRTVSPYNCNFHQKTIAFRSKSKENQVITHSRLQGIAISKVNVKTLWNNNKSDAEGGAPRARSALGNLLFSLCFYIHFWDCNALKPAVCNDLVFLGFTMKSYSFLMKIAIVMTYCPGV